MTNLNLDFIIKPGVEVWHVNSKDFYATMTLDNGTVSDVRMYELIYNDGKVLANAPDISIPQKNAIQYKQAVDKALEKALENMYGQSNYYTMKNLKPDPTHWLVLKNPKWLPQGAPKDCIHFYGRYDFELYYEGIMKKAVGNLYWGYVDKNLNVYGFGIKAIGLK